MRVVATAAALIILPVLFRAQAKDDRSLTDIESRIGSPVTTVSDSDSNTIGALKEKLLLAETTIAALTSTVAEMGNSAEVSRRELENTQFRLQSFSATKSDNLSPAIEKKLIECLRELRIFKENNEAARRQLLMLVESVQMLLLTASEINPQSRMSVEAELRKSTEVLGASNTLENALAVEPSLNDGIVIETKDEISLVVINIGKAHGVKIGMPFQVFRNGNYINSIKIVDVRDKISGGVIQSLTSDKIRVIKGDTLKVEAQK